MITSPGGQICYFVLFSTKSAFFKLNDIFPECAFHREHAPQVDSLQCLQEDHSCHVNHNCMATLVHRVHVLFQEVLPSVQVIVLYFRKHGNQRYGAGLFWRDMREPRVIVMNPWAWERIKQRGNVFAFTPTQSFFLTGQSAPPEIASNSAIDQKI